MPRSFVDCHPEFRSLTAAPLRRAGGGAILKGGPRVRPSVVSLLLLFAAGAACGQDWIAQRRTMVDTQIVSRGIKDERVIDAMLAVPRHLFVPQDLRPQSYGDYPLPIGEGQTISQPYIVALMSECLGLTGQERVLEVGTGSGYQAAVLSRLARNVWTIEIRKTLADRAATLLASLRLTNVTVLNADGYYGLENAAPFDAIMITASVNHVPPPLLKQLRNGGRMVLPLGNPFSYQELVRVTKTGTGPSGPSYQVEHITGVLFVPLTGRALEGGG
jgi:protein-L-isoaspartate(D-aspartate) O-methyltransferase